MPDCTDDDSNVKVCCVRPNCIGVEEGSGLESLSVFVLPRPQISNSAKAIIRVQMAAPAVAPVRFALVWH